MKQEVTDFTADWWFHRQSLESDSTKLREIKLICLFREPRSSSLHQSISLPDSEEITDHKSFQISFFQTGFISFRVKANLNIFIAIRLKNILRKQTLSLARALVLSDLTPFFHQPVASFAIE